MNDSKEAGDPRAPLAARVAGCARGRRTRIATVCTCLFFAALGTRILCWQDNYAELLEESSSLQGLAFFYHDEVRRIDDVGGYLFPRRPVEPGDARMLIHPPGYPIIMSAFFKMSGGPDKESRLAEADLRMRVLQITFDSLACLLVFAIACELLPLAVATIAGLLAGLSPHLAYYSLLVAPDSLAAFPVLLAVYLIIRAGKRPRLATILAAGVMVGLSCWLRSNALLLAFFLAAAAVPSFPRGKRLTYSLALIGAAVIMIAPITIRNWVVYHRFIPLSLGAGITMMEGIGDFDKARRFDLPSDDAAARAKDVEWYGRPDYADNLWVPDGIERDRARMARAMRAVRSDPLWFFGVMLRRMAFMVRYNDFKPQETPFTTIAPSISASPTFGHRAEIIGEMTPVWSSSAHELMAGGTVTSPGAAVSLSDDEALEIFSGDANHGDQFASAMIVVRENTDYVLRLGVTLEQGPMEIKVGTDDPRIDLAVVPVPETQEKRSAKKETEAHGEAASPGGHPEMTEVNLYFASADRRQVRLVFSNSGASTARRSIRVGRVEMFEAGPTPNQWTRHPRTLIRGLQKNIFKTALVRSLILAGVWLLWLAGRRRGLAALLAVPAYYLLAQSAFHTEYRYILAIHYFLFVAAAAAIYCMAAAIRQSLGRWYRLAKRKNARASTGSP
ncbi:MAG: ArnT family glycosyltransferase [Blastocatellia bacterium]